MYYLTSLFLITVLVLFFGIEYAFAHSVHSAISGSPIGASGINDWHLSQHVSEIMFQISLVMYATISGLLGYALYQRRLILRMTKNKKNNILAVFAIFLMIFGVDGILLLDSTVSGCRGFAVMGILVFIHLGFDSRAIYSNPDCLVSFSVQIIGSVLFTIGLSIILYVLIKKQQSKAQNNQKNILA